MIESGTFWTASFLGRILIEMSVSNKPILTLNFDGVIHSYLSGWRGADNAPDVPVPGVREFILEALGLFTVVVFSSRSHQEGGITEMRRYLVEEVGLTPNIVAGIDFPTEKPPAFMSIDDRGFQFNGSWPDPGDLINFKPWYLRDV